MKNIFHVVGGKVVSRMDFYERPASEIVTLKTTLLKMAGIPNGPELWRDLHLRAMQTNPGQNDVAWLATFRKRLPCSGCRQHWDAMVKDAPPDWNAYFAWTVARHNEVNARLGKRQIALWEAEVLWASDLSRKEPGA
jgi:hypothetical protein